MHLARSREEVKVKVVARCHGYQKRQRGQMEEVRNIYELCEKLYEGKDESCEICVGRERQEKVV